MSLANKTEQNLREQKEKLARDLGNARAHLHKSQAHLHASHTTYKALEQCVAEVFIHTLETVHACVLSIASCCTVLKS